MNPDVSGPSQVCPQICSMCLFLLQLWLHTATVMSVNRTLSYVLPALLRGGERGSTQGRKQEA